MGDSVGGVGFIRPQCSWGGGGIRESERESEGGGGKRGCGTPQGVKVRKAK